MGGSDDDMDEEDRAALEAFQKEGFDKTLEQPAEPKSKKEESKREESKKEESKKEESQKEEPRSSRKKDKKEKKDRKSRRRDRSRERSRSRDRRRHRSRSRSKGRSRSRDNRRRDSRRSRSRSRSRSRRRKRSRSPRRSRERSRSSSRSPEQRSKAASKNNRGTQNNRATKPEPAPKGELAAEVAPAAEKRTELRFEPAKPPDPLVLAATVLKNQITGFLRTVSSLGEPLPEQMGFFLEGLVSQLAPRLRQVPEEVSEWFADGFEKIGWNVMGNALMGDGYMLGDSIAVLDWLDKAHTQANDSDLMLTVLENGEHEWVCNPVDSDMEDQPMSPGMMMMSGDMDDDAGTFSLSGALAADYE